MTQLPDHDYTTCADECPRCTANGGPRTADERAEMLESHYLTACPTPGCGEDTWAGAYCTYCREVPEGCDCGERGCRHCDLTVGVAPVPPAANIDDAFAQGGLREQLLKLLGSS